MFAQRNKIIWLQVALLALILIGVFILIILQFRPSATPADLPTSVPDTTLYDVVSVIDGDTIKVNYAGKTTSVRLIGIDAPETVDSRVTPGCFGAEASAYLKSILSGQQVILEADPTQSDRDKYDRLLRYVYLNGEDIGLGIISGGYGYEYTYDAPYAKQSSYKTAESEAKQAGRGLWAPGVCDGNSSSAEPAVTPSAPPTDSDSAPATPSTQPTQGGTDTACNIKGNINSSGAKIYHMPGQQYYDSTNINTEYGERWFCSEAEAEAAGWRKSKV